MFDEYEEYFFGDLLRSYRERKNRSRLELEERTGRHRNTIGAWERGDYLPKYRDDILLVAEDLQLTPFETDLLLYKANYPLEYQQVPTSDHAGHVADKPYGYLRVQHGGDEPLCFTLHRARHVLGRHPARCDLVIPDQFRRVSRVHAAISQVQERVMLADLASTNHTYVDGWRVVEPMPLEPGQHVLLGGRTAAAHVCVLEFALEPVETL